jgi:branched-chain amino acid transport system permease protein
VVVERRVTQTVVHRGETSGLTAACVACVKPRQTALATPTPAVQDRRPTKHRETRGVILLQVVVSGLLMGAVYALFSSGLTLIWGMMNVVNFAHGDFVMLAMYAAFFAYTLLHLGPVFFIPGAALLLFGLGVVVYLGLVRHIARGPMLAQILGTFGLALVLRYAAFWAFSANFVSLPDTLVGGTFNVGGIRIEASRLLGGVLALLITLGLHLMLTRTMLGSRILAVAEDRNAAMLMGIRPDRMQAIAWGIGASTTGVAGALIAMFFYISPTVGESLSLIAFVVVCLGGFGSVPGALVAGLAIGVIEALSAYLIGAVYQDVVVYALFLAVLWVRPQGLMGTA